MFGKKKLFKITLRTDSEKQKNTRKWKIMKTLHIKTCAMQGKQWRPMLKH